MIYVVGERDTGTGRTGRRLAALAGVTDPDWTWVNLFDSLASPVTLVRAVESRARPGDAIILLGRRVASEFLLGDLPWLSQVSRSGGLGPVILLLPHPSGRNRWYNDPANVDRAKRVLAQIWRENR